MCGFSTLTTVLRRPSISKFLSLLLHELRIDECILSVFLSFYVLVLMRVKLYIVSVLSIYLLVLR